MMKINHNCVDVLLFVEKIRNLTVPSECILYLNVVSYRHLGLWASETPKMSIIFGI